jgi:hypothetical protein
MTTQKIATCCYCGTRAALVLRGRERHELSCASCGAPLHDLKMLRSEHSGKRELVKPSPVRSDRYPYPKRRRPKRRKSLKRRLIEEAWDFVEDIFD